MERSYSTRATLRGKGKAVSTGALPSSPLSPQRHIAMSHLAVAHVIALSDDLPTLKALRWALLDERVVLSELYVEGSSQAPIEQLSEHLSEHTRGLPTLCAVSLRERPDQLMTAIAQRHHDLQSVVCTRAASVDEARVCFKAGALDYLPLSLALSGGLCELLLGLLQERTRPSEIQGRGADINAETSEETSAHSQASAHPYPHDDQPLTTKEHEALLERLICEELSFQEAITPIEDELRRRYLRRLLEREDSIAAAARHAGVERANFKRLLKRYGV